MRNLRRHSSTRSCRPRWFRSSPRYCRLPLLPLQCSFLPRPRCPTGCSPAKNCSPSPRPEPRPGVSSVRHRHLRQLRLVDAEVRLFPEASHELVVELGPPFGPELTLDLLRDLVEGPGEGGGPPSQAQEVEPIGRLDDVREIAHMNQGEAR